MLSKNLNNNTSNFANLAQCRNLTNGNLARAVILQKLTHYCDKARFGLDGHMYSAPTTSRLKDELGFSESTIFRALRELKNTGVIEIKNHWFRQSPRRYIRILRHPAEAGITISEMEGEPTVTHSNGEGAHSPVENVAPSPLGGVKYKIKKKKENQNNVHAPEQRVHSPEMGQSPSSVACGSSENISGEVIPSSPKGPLPPARRGGMIHKFHATHVAGKLADRRGWDIGQKTQWHKKFRDRQDREFSRARYEEAERHKQRLSAL